VLYVTTVGQKRLYVTVIGLVFGFRGGKLPWGLERLSLRHWHHCWKKQVITRSGQELLSRATNWEFWYIERQNPLCRATVPVSTFLDQIFSWHLPVLHRALICSFERLPSILNIVARFTDLPIIVHVGLSLRFRTGLLQLFFGQILDPLLSNTAMESQSNFQCSCKRRRYHC